jgi:hypothetical protein
MLGPPTIEFRQLLRGEGHFRLPVGVRTSFPTTPSPGRLGHRPEVSGVRTIDWASWFILARSSRKGNDLPWSSRDLYDFYRQECRCVDRHHSDSLRRRVITPGRSRPLTHHRPSGIPLGDDCTSRTPSFQSLDNQLAFSASKTSTDRPETFDNYDGSNKAAGRWQSREQRLQERRDKIVGSPCTVPSAPEHWNSHRRSARDVVIADAGNNGSVTLAYQGDRGA